MDSVLLELCEAKINKATKLSWDEISVIGGFNGTGEALRCKFKAVRKKLGKLSPQEPKVYHSAIGEVSEVSYDEDKDCYVDSSNMIIETNFDACSDYTMMDDGDDSFTKMLEMKKENIKLQDQRHALNRLLRKSARFESLAEVISDAIMNSDLVELKPSNYCRHINFLADNEMVVCFSDFHYGLTVNNHWNKFDHDVFVHRLSEYVNRIILIGKMHKVERITILNLGDMISGNIHTSLRIENTENVVKQTQTVAELISNALYKLSEEFLSVDYYTAIGNHGRVTANKKESIAEENFEVMIPWYIRARMHLISNVTIHENMVDSDVIVASVLGHIITGCHGDKDRIPSVAQNMTDLLGEKPHTCFLGHLHHYAEDVINGVNVIMSGSLIGTDDYAKDIRKIGSASQTICIFNKEGKVCSYNVVLR